MKNYKDTCISKGLQVQFFFIIKFINEIAQQN